MKNKLLVCVLIQFMNINSSWSADKGCSALSVVDMQQLPTLQALKMSYIDSLPKLDVSSIPSNSGTDVQENAIGRAIVTFLTNFLHVKMKKELNGGKCLKGEGLLAQKISSLIEQGKPLVFVLPAFPSKSLNSSWVTGKDPDLGEYLRMPNLESY